MREIKVGKGVKPGARIDEYLLSIFPALARGTLYKAFRKKDVKVCGKWSAPETRLSPGDIITVYLPDDALFGDALHEKTEYEDALKGCAARRRVAIGSVAIDNASYGDSAPQGQAYGFTVVYEDARLLIVDKAQGIPVHPDRNVRGITLIELVWEYLGFIRAGGNAPAADRERSGGCIPAANRESSDGCDVPATRAKNPDGCDVPATRVKHSGGDVQTVDSKNSASGFAPALCHRIDRNTGGLVVIAKDREALDLMMHSISNGGVKKYYRCIVKGRPSPPEATLRGYMAKDTAHGLAIVYDEISTGQKFDRGGEPHIEFTNRSARSINARANSANAGGAHLGESHANTARAGGAHAIITRYRTLGYDKKSDSSKLEVSILTGRTHQIRAHLAAAGHPIIGDGKYCPNYINKQYDVKYQMLVAYKLKFPALPGLDISGTTVEIPDGLEYPVIRPRQS